MFRLFPITWLQLMRLRLFYYLLAGRCIQADQLPIVLSDIIGGNGHLDTTFLKLKSHVFP